MYKYKLWSWLLFISTSCVIDQCLLSSYAKLCVINLFLIVLCYYENQCQHYSNPLFSSSMKVLIDLLERTLGRGRCTCKGTWTMRFCQGNLFLTPSSPSFYTSSWATLVLLILPLHPDLYHDLQHLSSRIHN